MGPVFATPKALERAGPPLDHMDWVEMHEAFAARIASNLQAFASKKLAEEKLGRSQPIGEVDPERLNVNGLALARSILMGQLLVVDAHQPGKS
jgi:acetyl-CoA acyltransferase